MYFPEQKKTNRFEGPNMGGDKRHVIPPMSKHGGDISPPSPPGFTPLTKTALKKLKVAYNNSLRRFMGLPWSNSASEMFVNLNIRSFDELLRMFVFEFRSRIINSNDLLISSIYNSTCRIYSSIWTWWDNLLYIFNS